MVETTAGNAGAALSMDPGRVRRRVLLFGLALLGFQLVVPLTYYFRDDPYDERFAWRMFSAERMHVCSTRAVEIVAGGSRRGVRPIPLETSLHQAWLTHIKRNRRPVVHRFLEWRCEGEGVTGVRLTNRCLTADRTPLAPRDYAIDCATGAISERAGPVPTDVRGIDTRGADPPDIDADSAGTTRTEGP
jgi:hypothetical protein